MALAQRLDKSPARTFVLMGDGECAEGQVWEAAAAAACWKLRNLVAIVDVNRLGQSDPTMHQHDLAALARKFRAFGWDDIIVDGHKIDKILAALKQAGKKGQPTVILARTLKGKGVSFIEDKNGWHGKPLKADELARALEEIGCLPDVDSKRFVRKPKPFRQKKRRRRLSIFPGRPTRRRRRPAWPTATPCSAWARSMPKVVAIDGDVKNSTYADKFFEAFPGRSFQSFIAEQNMVGVGMGLAAKGYLPFMATFAAFLTRAHDQIRMAAYSFSNIKVCGSHVGVSIGEDGPSQMGLEDLAMFRPIPGCVVLYPSDAVSSEACVAAAAAHQGHVLHPDLAAGDADPLSRRARPFPSAAPRSCGKGRGTRSRSSPPGSPSTKPSRPSMRSRRRASACASSTPIPSSPWTRTTILREVAGTGGRAVVVEDHYAAGGLGEAVAEALAGQAALRHLCVRELPRSGKPDELLERFGISASHIVRAARGAGSAVEDRRARSAPLALAAARRSPPRSVSPSGPFRPPPPRRGKRSEAP